MKETKDQTIIRLQKVIAEQKSELTEVKKDRKRLNYAVERLERENSKSSIQRTKDNNDRTIELENHIALLKSTVENLNDEISYLINEYKEKSDSVYKIFITWVEDPNIDQQKVELVDRVFSCLYLPRIGCFEKEFLSKQKEFSIEYQYKGSYEGYRMLKKSVTAFLKSLGEHAERHIEIHGEKIEE